jgi:hypothetical protein
MSGPKKKTPTEELIESLLKDVGEDAPSDDMSPDGISADEFHLSEQNTSLAFEGLVMPDVPEGEEGLQVFNVDNDYSDKTSSEFEDTRAKTVNRPNSFTIDQELPENMAPMPVAPTPIKSAPTPEVKSNGFEATVAMGGPSGSPPEFKEDANVKTQFIPSAPSPIVSQNTETIPVHMPPQSSPPTQNMGDSDKTVAVAGYQVRGEEDYGDKVKITVGQNRASSGYAAWNNAGSADSNLAQAENLRIAQEKIIELEQENEKIRQQNEELMAASEIIKERSDLLSQQITEYRGDREGLESSFKNEVVLLKNHLARKDTELQRAQFKAEELESRLKFDMKKIRVRERELENRLELIRAEKNAIVKNKDEQILDLRRKMDVLQMEVESYRQKCVELNKSIESSQESFKRTTRALRLAMANLELQEENKVPLKKVD